MAKLALTVLGLILLVLAGLLAWLSFSPPAARPNVLIAFAGYTNDANNLRLASFTVSNASPSIVVNRRPQYQIQFSRSNPHRVGTLTSAMVPGGESILPPGGSETLTVAVPTNQPSWRFGLYVKSEVGVVGKTMNIVSIMARSAGLPMKKHIPLSTIYSDWISE